MRDSPTSLPYYYFAKVNGISFPTKTQEDSQKQHKEQIEAANKQNTALQERLKAIQEANKK